MKAILVIDLKTDELPKDGYANIYVFGKYYEDEEDDFVAYIKGCPLKPIPERLAEPKVEWGESRGYQGGWNDCIEEIIGKNEEA